jgi:RHS repeat-associated protein
MSVYKSGNSTVNEGRLTQAELHLYGSSRLGLLRRSLDVAGSYIPDDTTMPLFGTGYNINFGRGNKLFELSNHLGNVLVTLNDKKLGVSTNNNTVDYFNPQVISAQDYYPFGMLQPGRVFNTSGYRFGFNGKENDNEVKGDGNQQDYGMRVYDPRLGKFLSIDPLTKKYPWNSVYAFAENDVVRNVDLDGAEKLQTTIFNEPSNGRPGLAIITVDMTYRLVNQGAGAANNADYNPIKFNKVFSGGNIDLNMATLPSPGTTATEANQDQVRAGNYYTTHVFYNYRLETVATNFTTGILWLSKDPSSRGLIWNTLSSAEQSNIFNSIRIGLAFSPNRDFEFASNFGLNWNRYIRDQVFPAAADARAAASNESILHSHMNFTILRIPDPGVAGDLSKTEVVAHESGHSAAQIHLHSTRGYGYTDRGLSSNQPGQVTPTKINTINILNDKANRDNSQTILFDNNKLRN